MGKKKMGKRHEQTFHQKGYTGEISTRERLFSIFTVYTFTFIWDINIYSYIPLGKQKLKLQRDIIKHLLAWLKWQTVTTPKGGEGAEKSDHIHIADWNIKWYSHSGKQFGSPFKTNNTLMIWPSNYTLGHLFQRNENLSLHKYLYANVHSSFIHNSLKLETTQMFFTG